MDIVFMCPLGLALVSAL